MLYLGLQLVKGVLHSTSLIGIHGKVKAKQNYLICNILIHMENAHKKRQHQVSALHSIIKCLIWQLQE